MVAVAGQMLGQAARAARLALAPINLLAGLAALPALLLVLVVVVAGALGRYLALAGPVAQQFLLDVVVAAAAALAPSAVMAGTP